jgi:pSer/pThr/pTyr-binding forkhead associated (FHA) protein
MAAKLILSMDGLVLKEFPLDKERITIGRKETNDIHIDNLAVSGNHAVVVTILNDSFLEDLNSTNGTLVNGKQVQKHFLQDSDVIEIGKYKLKYVNEQVGEAAPADYEKTMVLRKPAAGMPGAGTGTASMAAASATASMPAAGAPAAAAKPAAAAPALSPAAGAKPAAGALPVAAIQILTGPSTGRELEIHKSLTTLGKPGHQVAVIAKRPHGYFITHVEGGQNPVINGEAIGTHPRQLNDHDIIELAGVKMEFFFKA